MGSIEKQLSLETPSALSDAPLLRKHKANHAQAFKHQAVKYQIRTRLQ
jgi:hypothetical protein